MNKIILLLLLAGFGWSATALAQSIPPTLHARIIQLEDERNLNGDELAKLLKHASPKVRERAALAIGRIGDKRGTDALIELFNQDQDANVRAMAAFALGEMEDAKAATALSSAISSLLAPPHKREEPTLVRARVCEALGKILSANRNPSTPDLGIVRDASELAKQLPAPQTRLTADEKVLAGSVITALMRLQVSISIEPLTRQLKSTDADLRAQAANALSRIRQPIASAVPALLEALDDSDHNVRANAARALGVSKDARAVEPLIKLLGDKEEQVQVSAIRALAAIGDKAAVEPLAELGDKLLERSDPKNNPAIAHHSAINPLLEIVAALGSGKDERSIQFVRSVRSRFEVGTYREVEIAMAKLSGKEFATGMSSLGIFFRKGDWRRAGNLVAAVRELRPEEFDLLEDYFIALDDALGRRKTTGRALNRVMPEILRSASKLDQKNKDEEYVEMLVSGLSESEVSIRSTAATLLIEHANDKAFEALRKAFTEARADKDNDAKLAILTALSKYKSEKAIEAVKTALTDSDHLVRRRAVDLLKQSGAGDFSDRIGIVKTGHEKLFYQRVAARQNKKVIATIHTDKGAITMELFPAEAPITVESFVTLARKGYFNGVTFHRVVPNFVIQGGDPRGTGEGGPGYQIRCEVNTRPYIRGAVGMALSGKDTGGSQFFITHSPQPHLDGGYTVFGQVTKGMDVVDRIVRGDTIRRIQISE